jgi:hypothetical protein
VGSFLFFFSFLFFVFFMLHTCTSVFLEEIYLLVAECQVPDFLIGTRSKKQRKKKKTGRPLKFFTHRSKLQAGSSDEKHHTDWCVHPPLPVSPLPFVAGPIDQNMRLWAWDALQQTMHEKA